MKFLQFLKITLAFSFAWVSLPSVAARSLNSVLMPTATNPSDLSHLSAYKTPPPPRKVGSPGQRSDGGARTGCASSNIPLTALVPVSQPQAGVVFGMTTLEHPSFWFYLPYQAAATGVFELQDQNRETIYETSLMLPQTPGVVRVTLPDTSPSLEAGKPYHWSFRAACQLGANRAAQWTHFVDGWIQRQPLSFDLQNQLNRATPVERSRLYSDNGIWFEALTTAAELRRSDPNSQEWSILLKAVGLEKLASEPISDCCKVGDR